MNRSTAKYGVCSCAAASGLQKRWWARHELAPVVLTLLERNFKVDAPNQVWTGEITCIGTQEGSLFLAMVIDLFNRQVVGFFTIIAGCTRRSFLSAQWRSRKIGCQSTTDGSTMNRLRETFYKGKVGKHIARSIAATNAAS